MSVVNGSRLPDEGSPEILRCPLELAVLRTKLLEMGEPEALLALVIDPPKMVCIIMCTFKRDSTLYPIVFVVIQDNIVRTIASLKEVGALLATANGKLTPRDGDLSYLGRIVSRLPMDVRLGKLVFLGYCFNILKESVIMAAGLGSKNIFSSPYQKKLLAYHVRMDWSRGSFSDPMTVLNAYEEWKELVQKGHFGRVETEKKWSNKNFIQLKALKVQFCVRFFFCLKLISRNVSSTI